jgi:hypothetical protein
VRMEAKDCFRHISSASIAEYAGLFEAYAASPYFMEERFYVLHLLESAPPSTADFVLKLLEAMLNATKAEERRRDAFELYDVGNLVLKVYASNLDNPDRMRRSLDLIDQLVEAGFLQNKLDSA